MALVNNVGMVNVTNTATNSGIFLGENNQFGWSSHRKYIMGGQVFGLWNVSSLGSLISDNSLINTPIGDQDVMAGLTNQQV